MKIFLGFDDTDTPDSDRGTGKLARGFENAIPYECRLHGVVRLQLLVDDNIPYTSHNSAACLAIEVPDKSFLKTIIELAVQHVKKYFLEGSDPGICAAFEGDPVLDTLTAFGHDCTCRVMSQKEALRACRGIHLSGHGGTNDGIIGAAAAVGLTVYGWSGRFIEFGNLRNLPEEIPVSELNHMGIKVVSVERDATVPAPGDSVITNGWLRPRLLGNLPVLLVSPQEKGRWQNIYRKRRKMKDHSKSITQHR